MPLDERGKFIFHKLFDECGNRIYAGNFSETGMFAKILTTVSLTEVLKIVDTKLLSREFSEPVVITTIRNIARTFSNDLLLTVNRTLEFTRIVSEPVIISITLVKGRLKELFETVTITQTMGNTVASIIKTELVNLTIETPRTITRNLIESVRIIDILNTRFVKTLTESITIGVNLSKKITKTISISLVITIALTKTTLFIMKKFFSKVVSAHRAVKIRLSDGRDVK